MDDLAAARRVVLAWHHKVQTRIEQVEDEATFGTQVGSKHREDLPLRVGAERELEDSRRRDDERKIAPEVERHHVGVPKREACRDVGW